MATRPTSLQLSIASALVAGLVVCLSSRWLASFHRPLLDQFVLPGVACTIVLVPTLLWLGRNGEGDRAAVARLLGTWAILCPLTVAIVAYVVLGLGAPSDPEELAMLGDGFSPWSIDATTFWNTPVKQALGGVAFAGLMVVRHALRAPARAG